MLTMEQQAAEIIANTRAGMHGKLGSSAAVDILHALSARGFVVVNKDWLTQTQRETLGVLDE